MRGKREENLLESKGKGKRKERHLLLPSEKEKKKGPCSFRMKSLSLSFFDWKKGVLAAGRKGNISPKKTVWEGAVRSGGVYDVDLS